MSGDASKTKSQADAELEREILAERKFTLEEAIGRLAGPGSMKGVSPRTGKEQASAEIENYLNRHLGRGPLSIVLLRYVSDCELLLSNLDQPFIVLASYVQRILSSDYALEELVRETDVEWGRMFDERPHFERAGEPVHPDDPYTLASVRSTLEQLLAQLSATPGG